MCWPGTFAESNRESQQRGMVFPDGGAQLRYGQAARLIIHQAFVESDLDAPKHLARQVHDL
jgi:hypothetical protein